MSELPDWPAGTVGILSTVAGAPHAIPVSTAVRAGDRRIVLALGRRRGSLQRLRDDPRVAFALLGAGGAAFTAEGRARVAAEALAGAESVAGVEIAVDRVHDHRREPFAIEAGVEWRWIDAEAERRDMAVRAALLTL